MHHITTLGGNRGINHAQYFLEVVHEDDAPAAALVGRLDYPHILVSIKAVLRPVHLHLVHQREAALDHRLQPLATVVLDATILVHQLLMLEQEGVPIVLPYLGRILEVDVVVLAAVDILHQPLVGEVYSGVGYLAAAGEDRIGALFVVLAEHGPQEGHAGGQLEVLDKLAQLLGTPDVVAPGKVHLGGTLLEEPVEVAQLAAQTLLRSERRSVEFVDGHAWVLGLVDVVALLLSVCPQEIDGHVLQEAGHDVSLALLHILPSRLTRLPLGQPLGEVLVGHLSRRHHLSVHVQLLHPTPHQQGVPHGVEAAADGKDLVLLGRLLRLSPQLVHPLGGDPGASGHVVGGCAQGTGLARRWCPSWLVLFVAVVGNADGGFLRRGWPSQLHGTIALGGSQLDYWHRQRSHHPIGWRRWRCRWRCDWLLGQRGTCTFLRLIPIPIPVRHLIPAAMRFTARTRLHGGSLARRLSTSTWHSDWATG